MAPTGKRLVILISGRGSNMESLLKACREGSINGHVVAVVSNKPTAAGLRIADAAGVPTAVVDHTCFPTRESFDQALREQVESFAPDLVILAGFMRILTPEFVRPFIGKLLNIHPSLLPKYPGLHTHQRALEAGDSEAGATVHFVTEELDGGPTIMQVRVPVLPSDDAETLAARVLAREHQLYSETVALLCSDRISYTPQGILLDGKLLPSQGLSLGEP